MIQTIRSFILCSTQAEIAEVPPNSLSVLLFCEETRQWYKRVRGVWVEFPAMRLLGDPADEPGGEA